MSDPIFLGKIKKKLHQLSSAELACKCYSIIQIVADVATSTDQYLHAILSEQDLCWSTLVININPSLAEHNALS